MADDTTKKWRLFCAIDVPQRVKRDLQQHIDKLRSKSIALASWTKVENIHLTLKFFGNVDQTRVETLSDGLSRATNDVASFMIGVGASGSFPESGRPKVLWISIEDSSGRLSQLQKSIERETQACGFPGEDREFQPHLTLARIRSSAGARILVEHHRANTFPATKFEALELLLIRSELSPKGSRYSVIQRYPFRNE